MLSVWAGWTDRHYEEFFETIVLLLTYLVCYMLARVTTTAGEWGVNDDLAVHCIDLHHPHPAFNSYLFVCLWNIEPSCSSLSHHSAFLFIFLPLFIWQFGWCLIKLTWGETEVSDCSQRRRSALFWTKQSDDNDSSCVAWGGGQTFLFSSVTGLFSD